MTPFLMLLVASLGVGVGVLIGCVGIGGVILVPALAYLGGIEIRVAIAAAMMGYLLTGVIGATLYARRGSIRWSAALWLCAGAMPAALAGAWAANTLPVWVLEGAIAALTASAGLHALFGAGERAEAQLPSGRPMLISLGVVTGFGSAVTGTGGPLILVPALLWLKAPVLAAIGLSQAVQFPIATLATVGNLLYGELDLWLGAILATGLAAGSALGAYLAHKVPRGLLRRGVAALLVLVGLALGVKLLTASP